MGKTIYAYVVADLLHIGHLKALEQAKSLGDYLIVGVLADEAVIAYKRRPIIPYSERSEMVAGLGCVDAIIEQDSIDPTENLKLLEPDVVVHGDDWDEHFPGADYMRSIGKEAVLLKYYPYQSTTKIIEKIRT